MDGQLHLWQGSCVEAPDDSFQGEVRPADLPGRRSGGQHPGLASLVFFDQPRFVAPDVLQALLGQALPARPQDRHPWGNGDWYNDRIHYELCVFAKGRLGQPLGVSCFNLDISLIYDDGQTPSITLGLIHQGLAVPARWRGQGLGLALAHKTADIFAFQLERLILEWRGQTLLINPLYAPRITSQAGDALAEYLRHSLEDRLAGLHRLYALAQAHLSLDQLIFDPLY